MKIIQVCKDKCGKKSHTVKVGSVTHVFCCIKGFKKTLADFAKSITD